MADKVSQDRVLRPCFHLRPFMFSVLKYIQYCRYIVGGSPSCAELSPWHAIIEYKAERKKRK